MASPVNFQCYKQRLISPIILRQRISPQIHVIFPAIRSSSSSSSPSSSNPKPSLLKTTCITLAATAALFSASLYIVSKPALTKPDESSLERHLEETDSTDLEALLSLAKLKFESNKRDQSIELINRLVQIDPENERKWSGMKARILSYNGETELAIKAFEEILVKDPFRVDAYHYLVMECYDSKPKLAEIEKRIENAIRRSEKTAKEVRGLRMLTAQIRVIEGKPLEAIRICDDVVKEDGGRDFRVYLFQGLVYSLMKNGDEAAKRFEKAGRLLMVDPYVMNANKGSEWRVIVDYDDVYCYLNTFAKLLIASALEKFN
ncbi:unnamed protein product [Cochlearia groenlandica]